MEVRDLVQTCYCCPSQWEFKTFENRYVYVRYRWGYLSIRIGDPDGDISNAIRGEEIFGDQLGNEYDGDVDWDNVNKIVEMLPNTMEQLMDQKC